ncbi:hypothetical protein [Microbacterium sp. zg.Y1084]|uniref:hypothetical protein n=1 Tax=Microbacterium sp. zg.Y1084 TaxID=2969667 RepID=UPI00214CA2BA|nr:hypothetical protein [Microbacterium sp. zg.Y1084]MCR2813879.1 hypothetical protein [Microbacterium sp. zg.Y1084]
MSTSSNDAEPSTSPPSSKLPRLSAHVPKPVWITLGVGFAILALVLALVPVVGGAIARNNATEELHRATGAVIAAHDAHAAAEEKLFDARMSASAAHDETARFVKETRGDLLSDPSTLETLAASLAQLLDVASLELDDAGAPVAPEQPTPQPAAETREAPDSTDEIRTLAEEQLGLAAELQTRTASLREAAEAIDEHVDSLQPLTDAVLASAFEYGSALSGMEKADEASRQGFSAAVKALGD